jgi:O-antigen/teichoic acid export membrane protein
VVSIRTRQAAHTMSTAAARIVVGGLTTIVVARALGPQGRGAYAVLVTVSTTAVILGNLSIDASHTSLWSQDRIRNVASIVTNSLLFGLVVGTLSAAATALAVVMLGATVVPVPSYGVLALALAAIPCSMTSLYLNNVLTLRGRIETVNWGGLLGVCVPGAALVLLAAAGRLTLGWVVALWTVSTALPLATLIPATRPRLRDYDRVLVRRALGMGLRYHIGSTSLFLLLRADILILNALTSTVAVGLYAVAVSLVELTRVAADSIAQVILSHQMGGDGDSAAALTARITRLNLLLAFGSVGLMCATAPFLIPFVYGPAFSGSVAPLLALAPGLIALATTRMISGFLLRLQRPLLRSGTALIALVVNVSLNLALIPRYGIIGCAIASSVSYCALSGMHTAWFLAATRTPVRRLLPGADEVRYLRATWSQLTWPHRAG